MAAAVHTDSGHPPDALGPEHAERWPHLSLATYAALYGAHGFGLTVPTRDGSGVDAVEAAVRGALSFIAEHRAALIRDHSRLLSEGMLRGLAPVASTQPPNSPYTLNTYPARPTTVAYLIPADGEYQQNRHEAAALVNHLVTNGVRIERTREELTVSGQAYPTGSYLIRLDQPRGALAAALLWSPAAGGAADPRATSGWSLPLAWGVACVPLDYMPTIATEPVHDASLPKGTAEDGQPRAYAYTALTRFAVQATNALIAEGIPIHWAPSALAGCEHDLPAGSLVLPADSPRTASTIQRLTDVYGIDAVSVCELPRDLVRLPRTRVAAHADPSVAFALRDLGFDVTAVTTTELAHLAAYDVLIVSGQMPLWERLAPAGQRALSGYYRGGRRLIAMGTAGADLVVSAGLADLDVTITSPSFSGMATITGDRSDPLTAMYPEYMTLSFVAPAWFTYLPEDAHIVAELSPTGPLVTGHWPVWDDINPAGQPLIVRILHPTGTPITLFGIDPTHGALNRHAFGLLAQAIYAAIAATPPLA